MRKRTETRLLLEEDARLFDMVLSRMMEDGKRPWEVCAEMGLAWGGVLAWVNEDRGRVERLRGALGIEGHLLVKEALEIADGAEDVGKARLQVDTRKWAAARLNPDWYGDKVKHEVGVELGDDGGLLGRAIELLGKVKELPARLPKEERVVELSRTEFEEI
jgi:hypothetical protein